MRVENARLRRFQNENETYLKALDRIRIDDLLNVLSPPTVPNHRHHGKSRRKECGCHSFCLFWWKPRSFAQSFLLTLRRPRTFCLDIGRQSYRSMYYNVEVSQVGPMPGRQNHLAPSRRLNNLSLMDWTADDKLLSTFRPDC